MDDSLLMGVMAIALFAICLSGWFFWVLGAITGPPGPRGDCGLVGRPGDPYEDLRTERLKLLVETGAIQINDQQAWDEFMEKHQW